MAMRVNEIAAYIHKRMCNDDRFGYSWEERHGASYEKWKVDGKDYSISVGDYDCSSSTIDAWRTALQHTKYRGALDAAITTRNMRSVFTSSGLFTWKPMSFLAEPGDLYLNEANHVAMCQTQVPDVLSEFSWGDNGAYGNKRGDQSGQEASVHGYYDYPWDGILHYNGKADGTSSASTQKTTPVQAAKKTLDGIDIASWQEGIDVAKVQADFVIVKVSGGTSYVNDRAHDAWKDWRDIANEVLKAGKLLGLYHYAGEYGIKKTGKAEAEFFLRQIKGFEGKAVLCLDWEADAQTFPVSYAKEWLDTVAKATGSTPMFYGYASYLNSRSHDSIKKYPLWMASYLNRYEWGTGYVDNPDNTWDTGSWDKMTMYQYASTRTIKGYANRLDVNVFYGSKADWAKLAGGSTPTPEPTPEPTPSKNPVTYRTSNDPKGKKWNKEYKDISGDGHSGFAGKPIYFLAMDGVKRYRVCTEGDKKRGIEGGWLPWVKKYDVKDLDKGCAGDRTPINGIQVDDDSVRYAVHVMRGDGEWYDDMVGLKDTGGSNDNFAGDLANRIDLFRAKRA